MKSDEFSLSNRRMDKINKSNTCNFNYENLTKSIPYSAHQLDKPFQ